MVEEIPSYSDEASLSKPLLFSGFNKLKFLVEDKDKEYFYEDIFIKIFGSEYNISIFGVGGKLALRKAFDFYHDEDQYRHFFYICDLDFDVVLQKDLIKHDRFIYLNKYEIENYLICETGVINFAKFRIGELSVETAQKLNFQTWYTTTTNKLYKLFLYFILVQQYDLGMDNTGLKADIFLDGKGSIKDFSVDAYYDGIKKCLCDNNLHIDIDAEIARLDSIVRSITNNDISTIIKGKYYLCSLRLHLCELFQKCDAYKSIHVNDLIGSLITNMDVTELLYIKERVNHCLKAV